MNQYLEIMSSHTVNVLPDERVMTNEYEYKL